MAPSRRGGCLKSQTFPSENQGFALGREGYVFGATTHRQDWNCRMTNGTAPRAVENSSRRNAETLTKHPRPDDFFRAALSRTTGPATRCIHAPKTKCTNFDTSKNVHIFVSKFKHYGSSIHFRKNCRRQQFH